MAIRLLKTDIDFLCLLAERRVMTTTQIAHAHFGRRKAAQRRLAQLATEGYLEAKTCAANGWRGRPERIYGLGERGFEEIHRRGLLKEEAAFEQVCLERIHCIDHELLLNWTRLHLGHIPQVCDIVESIDFLPSRSVLAPPRGVEPDPFPLHVPPTERLPEPVSLIPDSAFRMHVPFYDLSLLFFVEIDMGTEPLTSSSEETTAIRQKIRRYQQLILSGAYARLCSIWNCKFEGFRLLFIANTEARMTSICSQVARTCPSDFIWVTDAGRMFSQGLGDFIWLRGGRPDCIESILEQRYACLSALPSLPD